FPYTPLCRSVLAQIQRFDPPGVGARDLSECLRIQLELLAPDTPVREVAMRVAESSLERLLRMDHAALAGELGCSADELATAVAQPRSLDPRPGSAVGAIASDAYITP